MAKIDRCPQCYYYLFARYLLTKDEKREEKGTTVWYECANRMCNYTIKVFEPKEK
jgi:hypothetical protein